VGRFARLIVLLLAGVVAGVWSGALSPGLLARQSAAPPPAAQQPAAPPPASPQPGTPAPPAGQAQAGQGQPDQQRPPVFRAGVNFVRVDIIVTDRQGNAVTDLKAEDFEVVEDGKPQVIELFKVINSDGTPAPGAEPARPIRTRFDEEAEAAREDVRLFVIFLDDYHVRLGNSMRVREPLIQFVKARLGPLDMVAIMYPLMPVTGLEFTRNHDSIVAAIRKFEGRKYDYRPRNPIEDQYAYYPAQTIETIRNQVTISALAGLPVRLGSLREGRKAVILVSEGFTALLPPQMRDPMAALPGVGNPAARNPMAGDNQAEERARFFSEVELQNLMRDIYDAANRNNTAFYTLDPRGLATNEFDIGENINMRVDSETLRQSQDSLRVIAEESDGRAIVNQNDLQKGLTQILRDTSSYYLVGYNSSARTDGKFHKIDVRVKRTGLQLRSRKGYWAATPAEAAAAAAPPKPRPSAEVEKALGAAEARPRGALVTSWIRMSPGEDGRTRVTFVWEPLPPTLGVARQEPVAVQLVASGTSGDAYFRGRVPETDPAPAAPPPAGATGPTPAGTAPPVLQKAQRVVFEAKPGRLQLRMAVENARGQVVDTSVQEVVVPDLTEIAVRVTTPALFRARTAREYQALTRDADPVPTALREFRRTDRVLIRFETLTPGAQPPEVTVRLLNRVGQPMSTLPVTPPADGVTYFQVDLPLAGLAAGDYLIEVGAKSGPGSATALVAIKVTS
jgi:VWFA-related protein